jgi:uroporphyrinogen decarboxylase
MLRGMDAWFLDLAGNQEFVRALMRKLTDLMRASVEQLLSEAGEYIDVLITGDDLGGQKAPLLSTAMYRQLIKPYHAELFSAIKARSKAKIFYHSDGNIYPLLNDLIEVGIDLLNPVHVSAGDMGDTARLKREFGDRLAFCGAIDTQSVLPHGSPEDVRREVRRRIKDLAPGGGYILASVHCIQPDVPPENVCAMLDEALVAGRYPLKICA